MEQCQAQYQKPPLKSALLDIHRALLIRATKMNAARRGLFVDLRLVDKSVQN
jgi:hypothetical protein